MSRCIDLRAAPVLLPMALLLALGLGGCAPGQSPAERTIASVEKSYLDVRERVRVVAPQRAAAIELAIARAKDATRRGDWIGALAATQSLPGEIERLNAELDAEDRALDARWDSLNAELARALPEVDAGIERVAASRRLPPGVTAADVAVARAELKAARIAWTHAVSAREERRWHDAMNRAGEARLRARRALDAVHLPAVPGLVRRSG